MESVPLKKLDLKIYNLHNQNVTLLLNYPIFDQNLIQLNVPQLISISAGSGKPEKLISEEGNNNTQKRLNEIRPPFFFHISTNRSFLRH